MKLLKLIILLSVAISCTGQKAKNEEIISSNTYLIGKWAGQGKFLNEDLNKDVGKVNLDFEIKKDYTIAGKIGDATFTKATITKAEYGFEIEATLSTQVRNHSHLDKKYLVILLVIPKDITNGVAVSDANFHLKSSFAFDFTMRVGGVVLTKVDY